MEEVQLIQELKTGNKDAFDQLYDRYKDQALRTAVFLTGNRQDGEDTVQETFVKCYLHIQELHNEEGFKAWMYAEVRWQFRKVIHHIPNFRSFYLGCIHYNVNRTVKAYYNSILIQHPPETVFQ